MTTEGHSTHSGSFTESADHLPKKPLQGLQAGMETVSQKDQSFQESLHPKRKGKQGPRLNSFSVHQHTVMAGNIAAFEVHSSDFPELGYGMAGCPIDPQTCNSPSAPYVTPAVNHSKSKGFNSKGTYDVTVNHLDCKGLQPVLQEKETSQQTSWANVASLPPKKTSLNSPAMPSGTTESLDKISQNTKAILKKKKKRKKIHQLTSEDTDMEKVDVFILKEPPKFEDKEEFPELVVSPAYLRKVRRDFQTRPPKDMAQHDGLPLSQKEVTAQQFEEKVNTRQKGQGQRAEKPSGRKSKNPVQLDLGNMLAALELKQQSQKGKPEQKPVTLSVGGALSATQREPSHQKKPLWVQDKIAHNPLDSTSPLVKKGKQREVPKAKKPTPLKKVILKEREERKKKRLLEEQGLSPSTLEFQNTSLDATESLCNVDQPDSPGEISNLFLDGSEADQPHENTLMEATIPHHPKIHSRKFRDYCSQVLSKDVDECVTNLLKELVRFQDRLYLKDPRKARIKRRLVMGLREVLKHLRLHKVKCVIISPNCERIQSKGGLDEALYTIINTCREQDIPFVFALSRKALGRCVNKAVPVSLVGIFNYDGAQDLYHKMIELSSEARKAYDDMVASLEEKSQDQLANITEPASNPLPEESSASPCAEEPAYMTLWKKMLEKGHSDLSLDRDERFASINTEDLEPLNESMTTCLLPDTR
ncbi:selenocysteine insertion sequence-binding protein 2-like isoform X1 [Alosa sapidissima]|uniref:selenocysteine insertion sequence-binding protein 2-like isoform X1 n=1 Tax=Alosa sapidissima TaxID=34773 RepID=UPI001C08CDCD|nr:selenocysteine insertion sequence-binding protein 2-like isoform X1 [Alosa sapidissima]